MKQMLKFMLAQGVSSGIFRKLSRTNKSPLIVYYHRIHKDRGDKDLDTGISISERNFERQVIYLKENFDLVPLEFIIDRMRFSKPLGAKSIAVTFDDGYRDFYEFGYPILKKHGIPATLFLATAHIGTNKLFWWDKMIKLVSGINGFSNGDRKILDGLPSQEVGSILRNYIENPKAKYVDQLINTLKSLGRAERNKVIEYLERCNLINGGGGAMPRLFVSVDEIKEMENNGISFGSHTHTHEILSEISPERVEQELLLSRKIIEDIIGKRTPFFAYPDGMFTDDIKSMVQRCGYVCAFQTERYIEGHVDLYCIPRKMVKESHSQGPLGNFSSALFAMELAGVGDRLLMRNARKKNPYKNTSG